MSDKIKLILFIEGFIYFECPEYSIHFHWNSLNETIKCNNGIFGFLFYKFI